MPRHPVQSLAGRILPLGIALALAACADVREPEPRYITPLAWSAIDRSSGAPLTLLGSIHIGTADMGELHPSITAAYEQASELVVEVDLDADRPTMARAYAERAYLPQGERLEDRIDPGTWQRLQDYLAARSIDPAPLAGMKPWAVMLRLAGSQFAKEGYPAEFGVDRRFLLAAAGDKPIVALETYALQLDLYDGFPPDVQEMMLRDFLDPQDPYHTAALIEAWQRGDEQAFLDLIFPTAVEWQAYQERFFFERNEHMAERLAELSRDGRSRFVVVGVGHMVGPRGIPALLDDRGFELRRLGVSLRRR